MTTIPIEVQREGLSLASLQASLRGRWRGNCHPGELGTALRKLGFKRERHANANKLSDFPDFNDPSKLGSGKEMVDRLTKPYRNFREDWPRLLQEPRRRR
jgi:hypothetical protein